MERAKELRAALSARAQRRLRLPRLIGLDQLLRPAPVIFLAVLAISNLGTALLVNVPRPNKAVPALASEPAITPPETPIQSAATAGTSEPVRPLQSDTGAVAAEVIASILASEAAIRPPEPPIQSAATAGTSEAVKPLQSGTGAAAKNLAQSPSTEDVKLLISRADAFVAMNDLSSARLFYERAVAAGNAPAALRLGATYDPSFLSQAGLRFVRADPAAAAYWYERARGLGAVAP
jgi:hypothetical protein